jgi:hypothetical protein
MSLHEDCFMHKSYNREPIYIGNPRPLVARSHSGYASHRPYFVAQRWIRLCYTAWDKLRINKLLQEHLMLVPWIISYSNSFVLAVSFVHKTELLSIWKVSARKPGARYLLHEFPIRLSQLRAHLAFACGCFLFWGLMVLVLRSTIVISGKLLEIKIHFILCCSSDVHLWRWYSRNDNICKIQTDNLLRAFTSIDFGTQKKWSPDSHLESVSSKKKDLLFNCES